MKKTFILGLGAQKCGTTWLYAYLEQNKNFSPGLLKEYHIWNATDNGLFKDKKILIPLGRRNFLKWKMQNFDGYYFDYFDSLLSEEKNITADICPGYLGLSIERLQFIKDAFNKKNIHVKVVILARDPISRIKSAVNFMINKKKKNQGIENYNQDFLKILSEYSKNEHCIYRTNYICAIENAKAVFRDEDIYIGIYEKMFLESEVENLSAFLGIQANTDFGKKIVHKTKSKMVSAEYDNEIRRFYDELYMYFNENYPDTLKLWSK